jgi:5-formyltetrahydrofolate cyclo-ligase
MRQRARLGESFIMENQAQAEKVALREAIRVRVRGLSDADRASGSAGARKLLESQSLWREASSILFYAPLPGEVDLWALLRTALSAGKRVALPRYVARTRDYEAWGIEDLDRDIQVGKYGVREPADGCARNALKRLDLILVPGVAFDLHGHRLGRGQGFYDRLLAVLSGTTCGVAFDEQIVREIPVEPHDALVNCILTPTRWLGL